MSAPISNGELASVAPTVVTRRDRLCSSRFYKYVAIARPHHYPKNILVIVGFVLACICESGSFHIRLLWLAAVGIIATCLIASSNYVLNEILDARSDRFHPLKHKRPLATGNLPLAMAYLEWLLLIIAGLSLAASVGVSFYTIASIFQLMALVYNVPPVRLKDFPYIDVLCEALNSPLRLLLGWTIVLPSNPPALTLLIAFWMAGAFAMAGKRLKELALIEDRQTAAAYRKSFAYYTLRQLQELAIGCALAALLFATLACIWLYDCRM